MFLFVVYSYYKLMTIAFFLILNFYICIKPPKNKLFHSPTPMSIN